MSLALTPGCKVTIGGAVLEGKAASALVSVVACQDVAAPGWFELRMSNRFIPEPKPLPADDPRFEVGSSVEIEMSYEGRTKMQRVMAGEITGLEIDFQSGREMLTVRGCDKGHRLLRGRRTETFTQKKDSDIARQIAARSGLQVDAVDTTVTHDYVLQHNQTDWEFLKQRARNLGYEVRVEDKTLIFRPPRIDAAAALTLARESLKERENLIEFRPRLSAIGLAGQVVVQGWSPKDKEPIFGRASSPSAGSIMGGSRRGLATADKAFTPAVAALVDWPVFSPAEAEQIAQGRLKTMALSYVGGDGVAPGNPRLQAGTMVRIVGFGKHFSGLYYLASVCHTYAGDYRTAFTVQRTAT